MSELADRTEKILERKRAWHQEQAKLPPKDKVRILLELQKQDLPLLRKQRPLKSRERPWEITP